MIMLATFGLLVGAVLAQRFKIMTLIPVTAMMLVPVAGVGIAQDYTAWWMVSAIAAASASLQAGYVIGLVMRHVLEAPRGEADALRSGTSVRRPAR